MVAAGAERNAGSIWMSLPRELLAGLAVLHPADARWLRAQLPKAERSRFETLVNNAAAVETKTGERPIDILPDKSVPAPQAPTVSMQDETLLRTAEPDEIGELLSGLSPSCALLFLGTWQWPWTAEVQEALPADFSRRMKRVAAKGLEVPRLHFCNWLLHELADSLRSRRAAGVLPQHRFEAILGSTQTME
jgi:hypothetical protein